MKVDYVYKDLSWCAFVIRSWHRIHQTCLFRFGSWWPWSAGRNDGFHHAWNWSLTSLLYGIHVTCSYLTYHCLLYTTTCVSSILRKYNPGLKDNKRKQTWWFTATVGKFVWCINHCLSNHAESIMRILILSGSFCFAHCWDDSCECIPCRIPSNVLEWSWYCVSFVCSESP